MSSQQRWAVIVGALLLAVVVGVIAYNSGVAQGIEQSGKIVAPPAGTYPYPYHGWHHHPWGGLFIVPLFFFGFIFLMRALFWRGRWHGHHGYHHACGAHEAPPEK